MVSRTQTRSDADLLRDVNTKALAAHEEGRSEEALLVFNSLIKAAPRAAVFHNNRAAILADLGRDAEALPDFERAVELDPGQVDAQVGLGSLLWRSGQIAKALDCYLAAVRHDPGRIDAHLAIFELAQIVGDRVTALAHQAKALAMRRIFTEEATVQPPRRRVLVLKAPGDWQANMPTEYILDAAANTVHTWYVDAAELRRPHGPVPDHDLIFNAVAESDDAAPILEAIAAFTRESAVPLINSSAHIMNAARHRFPALLQGIPRCIAAMPLRLSPAELRAPSLAQTLAAHGIRLPFLLRPVDSQAGRDLIRIGAPEEIEPYLATVPAAAFYVTQFHNYAAADGFFRKYRIIFVDREP
ncbi:MAG: tetratricopeptide repeat protein, partial [Alphaproteobacteria bacterium]|nr:tetratricopeptide repeat protein [Alphaproteobacteria bacterium]